MLVSGEWCVFFLDVKPQWLSLVDVEVPPPSVKVTKLKKGERYRG